MHAKNPKTQPILVSQQHLPGREISAVRAFRKSGAEERTAGT